MAQEIYVKFQLKADKGSISFNRDKTFNVDWTLARSTGAVQNIASGGTAGVALVFNASVTTLGWAYFVNLDATNFIEIGIQTGGVFFPLAKLKAGEGCMLRLATGITVYARANTSAVDLEFGVLND